MATANSKLSDVSLNDNKRNTKTQSYQIIKLPFCVATQHFLVLQK